jgi:hypothetical protein
MLMVGSLLMCPYCRVLGVAAIDGVLAHNTSGGMLGPVPNMNPNASTRRGG